MIFKFRPHHLLCNLCFQGHGYNAAFVRNFGLIHNTLLTEPNLKNIQISEGIDDICKQCPKNIEGKCEDNVITLKMDESYSATLQLTIHENISLNEVKTKIKNSLTSKNFRMICSQCSWIKICEPVILQEVFY